MSGGPETTAPLRYGVILDAGSTGTRAHVYAWPPARPTAIVELEGVEELLEREPGISAFAGTPAELDGYLQPILIAASALVPALARPETRVQVLATAGMRALSASAHAARPSARSFGTLAPTPSSESCAISRDDISP